MDHRFEIVIALAAVFSVVAGLVAKRSLQEPPTPTTIEAPADVIHSEPLVKYQGTQAELKNDARW